MNKPKLELLTENDPNVFLKFDFKGSHKELFRAIKEKQLVVFYGAGVSRIAGCKGWVDLANEIINSLPIYSFIQKDELKNIALHDPRKAISICYHQAQKEKKLEEYYEAIKKALKPKDTNKFKEIHKLIFDLDALFYVTTNVDRGAEQVNFRKRKIFNLPLEETELNWEYFNEGNIIYLHGSLEKPERTIFTVDDYIKFYSKQNAKMCLQEVFREPHSVLFIGYSLDEYEILENIFRVMGNQTSENNSNSSCKYFLLTPLYTRDLERFNIESEYFKIFSVCTIPYFIDYKGYDGLFDTLINFKKEIEENMPPLLEDFSKIDQLLEQVE